MTPARARKLLGDFFGEAAVEAFDPLWPETMLQVAPGAREAEVLIALRRKLEQIEAHPLHGGDDARVLAVVLRSVAIQMIAGPGAAWSADLEHRMMGGVERRTARREPSPPARPAPDVVARLSGAQPEMEAFREAVLSQLAAEGMQDDTIPRLHMVAAMYELPPSAVDEVLVDLQYHLPSGAAHIVPTDEEDDDAEPVISFIRRRKDGNDALKVVMLLGGGFAALALLVGAAFAAFTLASRKPTVSPAPPQPPTIATAKPATPETPVKQPPTVAEVPPPEGMPDGKVLLRDLRAAVKAGGDADQQLNKLVVSTARLRAWWPRLDPSIRTASVEAIVEGAYTASKDDARAAQYVKALSPMTDGATGQPLSPRAVWSDSCAAGLLTRLLRERDLPRSMLAAIENEQAGALGSTPAPNQTTFAVGVVAWLRSAPLRLVPVAGIDKDMVKEAGENADRWHAAVVAVVASSSAADVAEQRTEQYTLECIERLLVAGPELLDNRGAFEVVGRLLMHVRFREGDASRERLLSWLGDQRIGIGDMHVVTSALAGRSGSAAVAPNMVLAPGATAADRDTLRAEYTQAWALSRSAAAGPSGQAAGLWLDRARDSVREANLATDDLEHLTAAILLARINQAASQRFRGEPGPLPGQTTLNSGPTVGSLTTKSLFTTKLNIIITNDSDGEWARRYLGESRNAAAKLARIRELGNDSALGPVDAEVLVEAALTGTGETRAAAQQAALGRANQASIINAVIEYLPRAPRSQKNAEFLSGVCLTGVIPPGSDQWLSHYRRALVERFLEVAAATNFTSAADRSAGSLADAYSVICGDESTEIGETDAPRLAVESAARLFERYRAQARAVGASAELQKAVQEIEFRRAGRLLVADGLVQIFAAHQVSAAEMLAAVVAAERPVSAPDCTSIIADMQQHRTGATGVTMQLHIVEEAMARLWALRLGEHL